MRGIRFCLLSGGVSLLLACLLACTAFRVGVRNPDPCALALRRWSLFGLGVRLGSGGTSWTARLTSAPTCPRDKVFYGVEGNAPW